jgi:hypothetical protein
MLGQAGTQGFNNAAGVTVLAGAPGGCTFYAQGVDGGANNSGGTAGTNGGLKITWLT